MAAVTVNSSDRAIIGSKRLVTGDVSTAATGDTWDTGLHTVQGASAEAPSTTSVGISVSGGVITFNYTGGGAMTHILVIATGL